MMKTREFWLCFSALLYSSTALATVDISEKTRVEVGTWDELKSAVENASENTVIVLTADITEGSYLKNVFTPGLVIDGNGHSISNSNLFGYIIKNTFVGLTLKNINFVENKVTNDWGGAIYNSSTLGNIEANFIKNGIYYSYGGGAIFNSGSIDNIIGDFTENYIYGDNDYGFGSEGGAISNSGNINSIIGNFTNNYAQVLDSWAYGLQEAKGGAIYNEGQINDISGDFSGNYSNAESRLAQGGAIYNSGSMTLTNSSFYNNYVQTSADKDSEIGKQTQGGAIYTISDLTIRADDGESIFSGNKVIWGDGTEDSSAVYLGSKEDSQSFASLNLDAKNDGLIQFDDKIVSTNQIDVFLQEAREDGATVTEDGNGGYIIDKDGQQMHLENDNGFFYISLGAQEGMTKEEVDAMLATMPPEFELKQEGDNYIVIGEEAGMMIKYQLIKQSDGTYTVTASQIISAYGGKINITGDSSSKVVFNNAIEKVGKIDISGTNVDVNEGAGTIYRTVTHDGGVLNINAGAKAEDSIINQGGRLNVADTAEIRRTEVNDGGTLHVTGGGYAEDTTVNSGGRLEAETQAKLHNMLANGGAILDIDSGAVLTGNIVIHTDAQMLGSYDYSQIFKDEVSDAGSLTLIGGLNSAMTESSLINTTDEKKLYLTSGDYVIGDGAQAVEGWDMLTLKDNATVKLEGDIALTGPTKKLIVENGSTIDLAGHSPSNYTITGSVSNDGMMTFSHVDDEADDITTIFGNYTAYNKAGMTIDVNPIKNVSDLLRVEGDVAGTTSVTLNIVGGNVKPTELIQFVEAPNDLEATGASFDIYRVIGSSFEWGVLYKDNGWYTGTEDMIDGDNGYGDSDIGNLEDDEDLEADAVLPPNFPDIPESGGEGDKPSPSTPSVVGEAIAYMGLPSAGIEQTRSMTRNVANKVASSKVYSQACHGFYDCEYNGSPLRNAWAAPVYSYSDVKAPYSYEAEISGFEGGFDIQSDVYNRLGVFGSYRQGSYDFDGDGDDYYSKVGADMDIDSYILGLYHRYDEGKKWLMSQIFLGYQDVSLSSKDGVSSSTDGIEFGGAIEGGLIFNPLKDLTVEPSLRLAYTQINYDDATDNYGKTAKYGDVRNIEIEAGVKVEKTYLRKNGYAKLYVKPSIIQNIGSGDVTVTSLRQVDGLDNATLGRLEIGGSMSFDEKWSGYANTSYTFGSDYTNASINVGLTYAF